MGLLASALLIALTMAPAESAVISHHCDLQWGNLPPLRNRCVQQQIDAAWRLRYSLAEAKSLGWLDDMSAGCSLSSASDYVEAAYCVASAIDDRKWSIEDSARARRGEWVRPETVPEEEFEEVRSACIRDFGLSFSAVQICIDHSTRNY